MIPSIDLAGARSRRQTRRDIVPCADSIVAEMPPAALRGLYRLVAPRTADTMAQWLRAWLRSWASRRGIDEPCLQRLVAVHDRGLSATIDAARHDPGVESLLAPELLLALAALEWDPDALRADWPGDRRELDALADVFGRPFAG